MKKCTMSDDMKGTPFTVINDTFHFKAGDKVKATGNIGITGAIMVNKAVGAKMGTGLFVAEDNLKAA